MHSGLSDLMSKKLFLFPIHVKVNWLQQLTIQTEAAILPPWSMHSGLSSISHGLMSGRKLKSDSEQAWFPLESLCLNTRLECTFVLTVDV